MTLTKSFKMISKDEKTFVLLKPRGFCSGVERAIRIAKKAYREYADIQTNRPIVHNEFVVQELEQIKQNNPNGPAKKQKKPVMIISAHGIAPIELEKLKKTYKIIDATCPLVTKVHKQARQFVKQDYDFIIIGDKNHEEIKGLAGEINEKIKYITDKQQVRETISEYKQQKKARKIAVLSQTTLNYQNVDEIVQELKKNIPQIEVGKNICYATFERQKAIEEITKNDFDQLLVIGSKLSANTKQLVKTGEKKGIPSLLIESQLDKNLKNLKKRLVITSGASTPEQLVEDISKKLIADGYKNISKSFMNTTKKQDTI